MSFPDTVVALEPPSRKCVILLDASLPIGMMTNAAAILGASLGAYVSDIIGMPARDQSGGTHPGLISVPLPILQADRETLRRVRQDALNDPQVEVFDFAEPARTAKTYAEYIAQMLATPETSLEYVALALHGPRAVVTKLTGHLKIVK
jgi:hypothetical protein